MLALNAANQLKLKRAYKQVEANTLRKVKQLALKLNIGYLLFSIGMLLVAEAAMALLNINSGQAFAVLTACTVTIAFYLWVLKTKFKYRWLGFLGKVFAVIIIAFSVLVMSAYLHLVSAVMILAAVYVISPILRFSPNAAALSKAMSKMPSSTGNILSAMRRQSSSAAIFLISRPIFWRWIRPNF